MLQARTAIGLSQDNRTLYLFTVDVRGGSAGMSLPEVAEMLIREGVYQALNLDGGGSTTMAMENPETHVRSIVNVSSDNPTGAPWEAASRSSHRLRPSDPAITIGLL